MAFSLQKAEQKEELSDYDKKNVAAQADGPVGRLL